MKSDRVVESTCKDELCIEQKKKVRRRVTLADGDGSVRLILNACSTGCWSEKNMAFMKR